MRAFNRHLNSLRPAAEFFRASYRCEWMKPREAGGKFFFPSCTGADIAAAKPAGVDLERWAMFNNNARAGATADRAVANLMDVWLWVGVWAEGVKVFCPTTDEAHALSQIEMNVPFLTYRQPFDTFVVVLPDGFYPRPVSADIGRPVACVSRLDAAARVLCMNVVGDGDGNKPTACIQGQYLWAADETDTIERNIQKLPDPYFDSMSDSETEAGERVKRMTINACLLLAQYGCRRLGSANPEYEAKLRAKAAKRLPPAVVEANRRALFDIPQIYGFDQHVRIFDREDGPHTGEAETGRSCRPHWRRGHWAHQPCGPGGAGRKLIFRRPVLVNAHRFAGELSDTRVTVTLR